MKKGLLIRVVGILVTLILLMGTGYLTYNILLLNGIETFYRIMLIVFIGIFDVLLIFGMFPSFRREFRKKKFIIAVILSLLFGIASAVGAYMINKVYNQIDSMNRNKIKYTSSLITLNDKYSKLKDLENIKIGMTDDKNDAENYIIPKEIIKDNNLKAKNEIMEFDDGIEVMKALYDGEIDAAFTSNNYPILYGNIPEFKDIEEKAKVITEKSKMMENEDKKQSKSNKDLNEPFTVLLLGVDSKKDGLDANAAFNGDTIMLITFDPNTLNATMFSIPRDTWVPITCNGNKKNKINSAAYGGSSCMIKTVEQLTGVEIDYNVKINFKGVVDLVDAMGGITVDVPMKFCEQNSDREWGSKTLCMNKGKQKLNGEQALALTRHRKTLALGDFARGQNQQLVVEGMINGMKNVNTANEFYKILNAVTKNIDTNLSTNQILSFYNVGKKMMFSDENNVLNIQKTFLRGYSMMMYNKSLGGYTYTFQYWKGSLKEITDAMKVNLGIKKAKAVKSFDFSINEEYERYIAGDKEFNETKISQQKAPSSSGSSSTRKRTSSKSSSSKKQSKTNNTKKQTNTSNSSSTSNSSTSKSSTNTTSTNNQSSTAQLPPEVSP